MIPAIQKKNFDRVAGLILEEIEGCELDPESQDARDLRRIVALLQDIAKDQDRKKPTQKQSVFSMKPVVSVQAMKPSDKQKPFRKSKKKWMSGPLAGTTEVSKPPWFSGA